MFKHRAFIAQLRFSRSLFPCLAVVSLIHASGCGGNNNNAASQAPAETSSTSSSASSEPIRGSSSSSSSALGSTYTHAAGLAFNHPSDWQVTTEGPTTYLIPADAPKVQGGPGELYVPMVFFLQGAASTSDPAVTSYIDNEVMTAFRCQRLGPIETIGNVVRHGYRATQPDGTATLITVWCAIKNGMGGGWIGIAQESAAGKREPLLRDMAGTIRLETPRRDPTIASRWIRSESRSDAATSFSMATQWTMNLQSDGQYVSESRVVGGNMDFGMDQGGEDERGIWAADGGNLYLLAGNGQLTGMSYRIVDGRLVIMNGNNRQIWER